MVKISYLPLIIIPTIFMLSLALVFADNVTNSTTTSTSSSITSATSTITTTSTTSNTTTTTTTSSSTTTLNTTSITTSSTASTGSNQTTCPTVPAPQCANNTFASSQFSNGCIIGYTCISPTSLTTSTSQITTSVTCPPLPNLDQLRQSCQSTNGNLSVTTDSNGCQHVACIPTASPPQTQLPSNCVQTTDNNGIAHISCTQNYTSTCQPEQILAQMKAICQQHGGTPNEIQTTTCNYVTCSLNQSVTSTFSQASCVTNDQLSNEARQCTQIGLTPKADFENGCTVVKCVQITQSQGAYFQSNQSGTCQKTIPDQAVSTCQAQGGEIVVQRDANGCITFGQCVARGDASQSLASPVQNVPSTTDLLSLAISLEQLKVQLYQAQSQVQTIANYYSSSSPQDAQRFQRVANMLGTAANKTNDIETELKSNIGNLTTRDLTQVKYDILYIKNVILKDAVYLMLGSNAQTTISTNQDCGSDSNCFDEAFRICEPSTFTPSADQPFKVTVLGLQGTSCQMKVELTSGPNAGSMICTFSDYALGFSSNPQKFLSNCQGSLVSYMQQYISQHGG